MAYCTTTDLIAAIGRDDLIAWTDDEGKKAIDQARVDAAITSADTLIDSFLRERYALPLDPVPALARDLSVDLTIVNLAKRNWVKELPPAMKERRDAAMRLLDRLASGAATLPGVTAAEPVGTGPIRVSERTRLFGDLSAY